MPLGAGASTPSQQPAHPGASSGFPKLNLYKEPRFLRAEADFGARVGQKNKCLVDAMPAGEEVLEW